MKKRIRRNKAFYTQVYRLSKRNDLSFSMQFSLKKELNELKRKRRKQAKFGVYTDWDDIDFAGSMFTVAIYSKKDDELLFFETYMTKDSLPKDKQYLWSNYSAR